MKVVRVPSFARRVFTPNELSGWGDCRYEYVPPRNRVRKPRPAPEPVQVVYVAPKPIRGGCEAQEVL